ncbi:ATP-binding protein [Pseudomonas sp. ZB1P45]|uniref:ATP-binding protein n=1 Tax=Pseudomonas frigoris TaxID=3398356 RepID=UPI0039EDF943
MSSSNITFQVETDRVLEILSKQIYDSPYAMVRENVQNSYDAVLMRAKAEGRELAEYAIDITLEAGVITIQDDGIGMSEEVLRNNFWKAGSSGKNNSEARAAGVIGTFGIGAMANFGVCTELSVTTRALDSSQAYRTVAQKKNLTIGQECISLVQLDDEVPVGTQVVAMLEPGSQIAEPGLRAYLTQFVQFLPVPVRINGELVSQSDLAIVVGISGWGQIGEANVKAGSMQFDVIVYAQGAAVGIVAKNFQREDKAFNGYLCLRNGVGAITGLRSRFGLAPLPVPTIYQLGGYADLPFLVPTAGREALTRDSITEASQIFPALEEHLSYIISETSIAESLPAFQQYVLNSGKTELAGKVLIQVQEGDQRVELGKLASQFEGLSMQWYAGNDSDTIKTFSSTESPLLRISQNHPRREVQQRYLTQLLKVPEIPDHASVIEVYEPSVLTRDEFSLTISLARVLRYDYMLEDVDIIWAKISHGVPLLAVLDGERVILTLNRNWSALQAVVKVIESSYELMDGFTKDLVRVHIYQRIQSFVPNSQRAGLDALQRTLERKRELYRLDYEDKGELEPLLADYLLGKVELGQVLTAAVAASSVQSQRFSVGEVGAIERVLPDVVNAPVQPGTGQTVVAPRAGSPILRLDTHIQERLLTSDTEIPQLNNHKMFLALSDRLFQKESDFFRWPHSTQVAWAGKRIVYLFSVANSGFSLYYDIELRGKRSAGEAGGMALATTTIVASNRIMVPVPAPLFECFSISDSPVEFYVRFDLLTHQDTK